MIRRAALLFALSLLASAAPGPVAAQDQSAVAAPMARMARRSELEAGAAYYDRLATSTAYGEKARNRARMLAAVARRRLAEGDFRVGDRLIISTTGSIAVTDTFTVLEGRRLSVT